MPQIRIGGELVEPAAASLLEVAPGVFSILFNGRSFEVRVLQNEAILQGHRFSYEIDDPRRWRRSVAGTAANGPASVVASMPGKVIRFLVAPGDEVTAGQGIVVVEAMKMQNELKSPRDGRITALKASPGDSVNAGAILALVE